MASRSIFRGQPVPYQFDPSEPTSDQDGRILAWNDTTKDMTLTDAPVLGINSTDGNILIDFVEDGGSGVFDSATAVGYTLTIAPGTTTRRLVFSGISSMATNLTGGGDKLTVTIPAAISGSAVDAFVGSTQLVNNGVISYGHIYVNGTTLTIVRDSGTFTAGPAAIKAFSIFYQS